VSFEVFVDLEKVLDFSLHMGIDFCERLDIVVSGIAIWDCDDLMIHVLTIKHVQHGTGRTSLTQPLKVGDVTKQSTSSGSPSSAMVPGMKP
jgi:hypothetical protein